MLDKFVLTDASADEDFRETRSFATFKECKDYVQAFDLDMFDIAIYEYRGKHRVGNLCKAVQQDPYPAYYVWYDGRLEFLEDFVELEEPPSTFLIDTYQYLEGLVF